MGAEKLASMSSSQVPHAFPVPRRQIPMTIRVSEVISTDCHKTGDIGLTGIAQEKS